MSLEGRTEQPEPHEAMNTQPCRSTHARTTAHPALASRSGPPGRPLADIAAVRTYLATGFGEVQAWCQRVPHDVQAVEIDWDTERNTLRFSTRCTVVFPEGREEGSTWRRRSELPVEHKETVPGVGLWTRDVDHAIAELLRKVASERDALRDVVTPARRAAPHPLAERRERIAS